MVRLSQCTSLFITFAAVATLIACLPVGASAEAQNETPVVTFGAFVDAYYSYNFNHPQETAAADASSVSGAALPSATNTYRYYDSYHNQMTLNLVEFNVSVKYKEAAFYTDLDFGPFADMNATVSSTAGSSNDEVSKHVGQAVFSYRPLNSRFFFEAGKMYTHVGLETIKSKDNFNYSRTVLFSYGMPFWHTGARFGYDVVTEKLQASFYVYNGWNSIYDTNESKTLGAQIKYTPSSALNLIYNFIGGAERVRSESNWKTVHEINSTYAATSKLTLAADVLYGSEDKAQWYGGLLAAKYALSDISYISPRFEIYTDKDGFALGAGKQTIQTMTFTYGRRVTQGFEYRAEARLDSSDENVFNSEDGKEDSQVTALAALMFNF